MDVSVGGAWVSPSTAEAYIGGAWRSLQYGEQYIGGAWRTIVNFTPPAPPPPGGGGGGGGGGGTITLSLSATTLDKSARTPSMTTPTVTVTPSGGLAPYTYVWSIVSADAGATFSLTAPTTATTAITGSSFASLDTLYTVTIHCVVTDSLGVTATSGIVTATFFQSS